MAEAQRDQARGRLKHRGVQPATPRRADPDSIDHLTPVSGRPPLREYLTQLLERRHFITMHAWSQSASRHRGTLLGNAWLILSPALDGMVYFLIFGVLMHARRDVPNYFGYLVVGVFLFAFTSRSVVGAASSISNSRSLIRAFSFPRAAVPVAATLRETFATLPVFAAMVVLLIVVPPHAYPSRYWTLVPLVFVMHAGFNLGLGLLLARITSTFADLKVLLPYFVRLWMYSSAVMFTIERFDSQPPLGEIVRANPMYVALTMYRSLLLENTMPGAREWLGFFLWAMSAAIVGMLVFWRGEVGYGRE